MSLGQRSAYPGANEQGQQPSAVSAGSATRPRGGGSEPSLLRPPTPPTPSPLAEGSASLSVGRGDGRQGLRCRAAVALPSCRCRRAHVCGVGRPGVAEVGAGGRLAQRPQRRGPSPRAAGRRDGHGRVVPGRGGEPRRYDAAARRGDVRPGAVRVRGVAAVQRSGGVGALCHGRPCHERVDPAGYRWVRGQADDDLDRAEVGGAGSPGAAAPSALRRQRHAGQRRRAALRPAERLLRCSKQFSVPAAAEGRARAPRQLLDGALHPKPPAPRPLRHPPRAASSRPRDHPLPLR